MSFKQFNIHPKCLRAVESQGLTEPTPIQREAIPVALEGRDVIAVAQTGTGKTLAFSLPSLTRLAKGKHGRTRMLVLTPTRELAQQVEKVIAPMAKPLGLRSVCVFGGVGMQPQTKALRAGTELVIATPGRLLDHIARGNVRFDALSILILDEADRMLDMGFLPDMRRIIGRLPKDRQTLLFSATFPNDIRRLAADFQRDPKRIEVGAVSKPVETVRQGLYTVDSTDKAKLLATILNEPHVKSAIVFIRTKHRTDRVARILNKKGIDAQAIHGGRSQSQRDKAMERFRRGQSSVLVATDVAARGIDIRGVTHVVNYDIPKSFDDYLHRIGRTGRANELGDAITFVSPEEHKDLNAIEQGLGRNLPRTEWEGSVAVRSLYKPKGADKTQRGDKPKRGDRSGRRGGKSFRPRRRFARAG
ncbi:MAG: DEAD/DEAH box helicase [Candidatus Hydrogenedentes bacterium]|nr:DEAD/DEAH box helicase [Candidatus Hydrogenedentota bacterium]